MAAPERPLPDHDAGNSGGRISLRQLGWFVLIWILSISALGAVAWVIRSVLKP